MVLCVFVSITYAQSYLIDTFRLASSPYPFGIYMEFDAFTKSDIIYIDMDVPVEGQQAQMEISTGATGVPVLILELESLIKYFQEYQEVVNNSLTTQPIVRKVINRHFLDRNMLFTSEGAWHREKGDNIKAIFYTTLDGKCYMKLQADKMSSTETVGYSTGISLYGGGYASWNKTTLETKAYGSKASWVFSSPGEIRMLIDKMNNVVMMIQKGNEIEKKLKAY